MTVLGIETATTVCGAAVMRDGVLLAEELVDERNVHAERLIGLIDDVLPPVRVDPGADGGHCGLDRSRVVHRAADRAERRQGAGLCQREAASSPVPTLAGAGAESG